MSEIGGGQRPRESGDRLHRAAHDERLAVRDPAGEAPGIVRAVDPRPVRLAALDDVVDLGAEPARLFEPQAELDTLHALDARDRGGERPVEPPVPVDVAPEADREPVHDDLEDPADRVAPAARLVDARDHPRLRVGVRAAQGALLRLLARSRAPLAVHRDAAHLRGERPRVDPDSPRNVRATPPAATRAAVSRAEARSRTSRTSRVPYFRAPARSAWPGRTRVTVTARFTPDSASATISAASSSVSGAACMIRVQLAWSRFSIVRRIGEPSVRPCRTPAPMTARSLSIAWRAPRPYPRWRRARSTAIVSSVSGIPAGSPSRTTASPGPCDSPAVRNRSTPTDPLSGGR